MKGRKVVPLAIKKMKGTARKHHKKVKKADDPVMVPPPYLPARAKEIFQDIYKKIDIIGYADASHSDMLGILALTLDEIEQLTEILKESGLSYQITNAAGEQLWKSRPEQKQRAESIRRAQSLLSEFCLSAGSAGKISIKSTKKEEDNPWSRF